MRIRLDAAEPDHIYRDGGRARSITREGRSVGVAIRHRDGWEATLWARPGKVRARWQLLLLWRCARALRQPPPAWWGGPTPADAASDVSEQSSRGTV